MALFRKNKDVEETNVAVTSGPKHAKKEKKKGGMNTIIHESVMESALDAFSSNESFVTERNGEKVYVGMLLDVADIGGLSKKDARDESKGQIIECINSGRIKSYVTPKLLDEEKMVIIPDAETLDAIDEFVLLSDAPYKMVYVKPDGSIEETDKVFSFNDAVSVQTGNMPLPEVAATNDSLEEVNDITDLIDSEIDSDSEMTAELEIPSEDEGEDEIPMLDEDESSVEDFIPEDDIPYDEDEIPMDEDGEEPVFEEDIPQDEYYESDNADDDAIEDDFDFEDEDDTEITEEEVLAAVTRKFYSDDLGLEVSTEPFDIQFLKGNPFIPFVEDRPEGWINDYLNQMSREANVEMQRMHEQNLFLLRERYFNLIAMHCEKIQKDLDITDSSNQYGEMAELINQKKKEELEDIPRLVSNKKTELNAEWEKRLDGVGQDAAIAAKRQYEDRYGKMHQEAIYRLEPDLREDIDHRAEDAKHDLFARRKDEASKRLDLGINETLKSISTMYQEMIANEQKRYKELSDNMARFVDENRKDEIARTNALADELAQKSKADKVTEEFTAKISSMSEEFDAKIKQSEADIAKIQRDNAAYIKEKQTEFDEKYIELKEENAKLRDERAMLISKYTELDGVRKSEYEGRINQLTQDKISIEERLADTVADHKKSNRVAIFAVVVSLIAALAIGILSGYFFGSKAAVDMHGQVSQQYQQQIEQQYEIPEQVESVDSKDSNSKTTENAPAQLDNNGQESGAESDGNGN